MMTELLGAVLSRGTNHVIKTKAMQSAPFYTCSIQPLGSLQFSSEMLSVEKLACTHPIGVCKT